MNKIANSYLEKIFCEFKSIILKNKVIKYLEKKDDKEVQEIVEFLKKSSKLPIFPYDFINKEINVDVLKCKDGFYSYCNNRKMFFTKKFKTKMHCKRYYKNILIEQDKNSPHRYLTDEFIPNESSIVIDVGGAEGYFALSVFNSSKEIHIFETDNNWIDALKKTFKDEEKVKIVNKFVNSYTNAKNVKLDDYLKENNLFNEEIFVKIDAEGNEESILEGMKEVLEKNNKIKLLICTYHKENALENISKLIENFKIETSNAYMLYYYDFEFNEPYLRRGLIRAQK